MFLGSKLLIKVSNMRN